ncbi:hypothetical protein A2U01_0057267, partial [Trifolium medium]|nr:hypothetical protein [Trifolium medium]
PIPAPMMQTVDEGGASECG